MVCKFKKFILSVLVCSFAGVSPVMAEGIGGYFKQTNPKNSSIKASLIDDQDADIPDWLKKTKRLEAIIGEDSYSRIENTKVVSKVETPIPGLFGFVVQADVFNDKYPDGRQELYVIYSDKTGRYLFAGLLIDMQEELDLNIMTERYVRGQLSDNPALALRPEGMYGISIKGSDDIKASPLYLVTDLSHESGRESFLNIVAIHQSLTKNGKKPREIKVVLVSAGKDELATAAMAMAIGSEYIEKKGIKKLVEYASNSKKTDWLQPSKLNADKNIKQAMGMGIFQLDQNSSQALLAKLDTLPLVYESDNKEGTKNIPLPLTQKEWEKALKTK